MQAIVRRGENDPVGAFVEWRAFEREARALTIDSLPPEQRSGFTAYVTRLDDVSTLLTKRCPRDAFESLSTWARLSAEGRMSHARVSDAMRGWRGNPINTSADARSIIAAVDAEAGALPPIDVGRIPVAWAERARGKSGSKSYNDPRAIHSAALESVRTLGASRLLPRPIAGWLGWTALALFVAAFIVSGLSSSLESGLPGAGFFGAIGLAVAAGWRAIGERRTLQDVASVVRYADARSWRLRELDESRQQVVRVGMALESFEQWLADAERGRRLEELRAWRPDLIASVERGVGSA